MKPKCASFVSRFGWGHLQHHDMPCPDCDDFDEGETCTSCRGETTLRWGSFYGQDKALCGWCRRDPVTVAAMYEGNVDDDHEWICLRCYVSHHAGQCGCALWRDAEQAAARLKPITTALADAPEGGK